MRSRFTLAWARAARRLGDGGVGGLCRCYVSLALLLGCAECSQGQAPSCFGLFVLRIVARLIQAGLRGIHADGVVGGVDFHQRIAAMDKLVVVNGQAHNPAGHFGRQRHDIGAHSAVARPGWGDKGAPAEPAAHGGAGHEEQR